MCVIRLFFTPGRIEIVYYGCGLSTTDFKAVQPYPVAWALNWAHASSIMHSIGTDPVRPGFARFIASP